MARRTAADDKTKERADERTSRSARKPAVKQAKGLRAFLYDAAAADKEVDLSAHLAQRLRKDQLLWIDVDTSGKAAVEQLRTLVDLGDDELVQKERLPIRQLGEYFSFTLPALTGPADDAGLTQLTCVLSGSWLVTAHEGGLAFIDAFDEHVRSDSSLGELDGPSFLASLLEWELNEYFLAVESVQKQVDKIEESILSDELGKASLDALVKLRRRVTYLRGGLTPHRYVYATLAHRSFDVESGSEAAADFGLLGERVEQAVQTTDSAREMIVGAFDLYMTRTAQHTNEVVKVLTIVSVLLLPASLLAGIFGMNMLPDVFMHSWFFVVVIALMVAVSGSLLYTLHRRGWL